MTAVIIANGQYPRKAFPRYLVASADVVVCCDGALSSLEKQGIIPAAVIGDMDSVCSKALERFSGKVVRVAEQDTNDLTKAFNFVRAEYPEVDTVHFIGTTGRSEAHTIANMSLLMEYQKECPGIRMDMVSDHSSILALCDSDEIHVGKGRRISIFTPDNTLRIKSEGLVWPLDGVVFDNWWKGSLNLASADAVSLTLNHKSMVLIVLD